MNLGPISAKVLVRLMQQNPNISKVIIPKNQIGDEGAKIISRFIMKNSTLVALDLSSNELTSSGGQAIFNALGYNNSIIDVNLSSFEGLNRNTLGAKGVQPLKTVLAYNLYLTILNVSGNFIGNKGLQYICEGLQQGQNQTLMKLNIALNEITGDGIEILFKIFPSTRIRDLNLAKNPLKNKGIKFIGDLLAKGGLVLESLNLQETQFTHQGAVSLYSGIKRNNKLKNLILDDNNLQGRTLNELSQALWTNASVTKLSLENCQLQDNGCLYLMDGLERNMYLKDLNLKKNSIEQQGAIRIAKLLESNQNSLLNLNLSENRLGDFGGLMIARAFQKNNCLTFSPKYLTQINKLSHDNIAKARGDQCPIQQLEIENLIKTNQQIHQVKLNIEKCKVKKVKVESKFKVIDDRYEMLSKDLKSKFSVVQEASNQLTNIQRDLDFQEQKVDERHLKLLNENEKMFKNEQRKFFKACKENEKTIEELREWREQLRRLKYEKNHERQQFVGTLEDLNKKLYGAEMSYQALFSELQKQKAALQKAIEPEQAVQEIMEEAKEEEQDKKTIKRLRVKKGKKSAKKGAKPNKV
ncbi:UNKNOWN [Stylonychia lemnae]|uniref:Leucine Rich Repeat family protein n=1 Tax=Stylonychia lemnae TaxID=5949 RepID=A0A078AK70_STYLE|nr:UNKNOWN [Stylonychia lemnae]|eukprot:CDW82579.1 UNKNOWN [Stylonychia lemnae]